jgi:hypothetical protein
MKKHKAGKLEHSDSWYEHDDFRPLEERSDYEEIRMRGKLKASEELEIQGYVQEF